MKTDGNNEENFQLMNVNHILRRDRRYVKILMNRFGCE